MSRKNAKFLAVFGDGAAGDRNAAFAEHFFERGIRVGLLGGFAADNFGQDLFGLRVGDGGAGGGFATEGGGKKEAQGDDAVGRADIFIGDRPADGGFVQTDFLGDLMHSEGMESGRALRKVIGLAMGDDFKNLL